MPLRNLFKRGDTVEIESTSVLTQRGFGTVSVAAARPIEVSEAAEHELSEIDDSGVFIPPSPTISKPAFWQTKSNSSLSSSNHRGILSDCEPFSISRESFDSYRRSFDISARSPVISASSSSHTRSSLDSSIFLAPLTQSSDPSETEQYEEDEETEDAPEPSFEDVKLNDESSSKPAPKKRGLFARFGTSDPVEPLSPDARGMGIKSGSNFQLFGGRKRGQSGQGAELRSMGGAPMVVVVSE